MMTMQAENPPSISLIFVNYQSASYLARALRSLMSIEGSHNDFEIIIVNNDEKESVQMRELQTAFDFVLIESRENGGFGFGANRGALSAQSEIIGFLNPDILWREKCLKEIYSVFQKDEQVGIVGMQLLRRDGKPEAGSYGQEPNFIRILWNNLFPFWEKKSREKKQPFLVDWVSGAAFFIRKKIFQSGEGFDERFFLYFEDVDLCRRVRKKGHKVVVAPTPSLIHYGGKSQTVSTTQKKEFYVSQEKYFKKHYSRTAYYLLRFFRYLRHAR